MLFFVILSYDKLVKKLLLSLLITLFLSSLIFFIPKNAYAACPSRPGIPIKIDVNGGKVTVNLLWENLNADDFSQWSTDQPSLFITIFDSSTNQRVNAVPANVPSTQKNERVQVSGQMNTGTTYVVHITDPDGIDANPPVTSTCTFEAGKAGSKTFTIDTTQVPPLAVGDDCKKSQQQTNDPAKVCPPPSLCGNLQGLQTDDGTCMVPPKDGESCRPEFQYEPGYKCPSDLKCVQFPKDSGLFVCGTDQTTNLPKTPCKTLDGGKDAKGYNAKGECTGVASGLGIDIPSDPAKLITTILSIVLSLSGGIAVILIIRAGYKLMVSQGDPEKIQESKNELTSAIAGLLFIIFSFVIIQFVTTDLLRLNDPKISATTQDSQPQIIDRGQER